MYFAIFCGWQKDLEDSKFLYLTEDCLATLKLNDLAIAYAPSFQNSDLLCQEWMMSLQMRYPSAETSPRSTKKETPQSGSVSFEVIFTSSDHRAIRLERHERL